MSYPITAIASITHRVCGVIVWVGIGFFLAAASLALESEQGFKQLAELLSSNFLVQFIAWGLGSATGYYCVGSLKHIIQDMGYFEDFEGGQMISTLALVLGGLISIGTGVLVWA